MAKPPKDQDELTEEEIAGRMLNTSPKPHKATNTAAHRSKKPKQTAPEPVEAREKDDTEK